MAWDDREKQEILLDEGRSNKAYPDKFGNYTIGVGHFLGKDPKFKDLVWDDDTVDETYASDFEDGVVGAYTAFPGFDGLTGPRKGALVNMAFQLGASTLSTFHTFLDYLDRGLYDEAALDLMNTAYARQVPARAGRIAYRIRTNTYSNDR